jgi:hypothetical protein
MPEAPAIMERVVMAVAEDLADLTVSAAPEVPAEAKPVVVAAAEAEAKSVDMAIAEHFRMSTAAPAETITLEPAVVTAVTAVAMERQAPSAAAVVAAAISATAVKAALEMIFQLQRLQVAAAAVVVVPVAGAVAAAETMAAAEAVVIADPTEAPELKELSSLFILLEKHFRREICSLAERRDHDCPLEN